MLILFVPYNRSIDYLRNTTQKDWKILVNL